MLWRTRSLSLIALLHLCLADALRIDDFDRTVIYHGPWTIGANIPDEAALNWDSTLHYSNISGATATLKFTGTSIAVYGSLHPPGRYNMQSLYSIDGQPPFTFIPNRDVQTAIHQSLFYSSLQFPYREHTLVVTNLGEQLFLDFFDVQDEAHPTSSSTTPAASTTTTPIPPSTSAFGGGQTVTVTASASAQPGTTNALATSDIHKTSVYPQYPSTMNTSDSSQFTTPTALRSNSATQPTTEDADPSNSTSTSSHPTITPIGAAQSSNRGVSKILSKGAIAGITMGSAIIIAVLSAGLWWYKRSRQPRWLATDLHFESTCGRGECSALGKGGYPVDGSAMTLKDGTRTAPEVRPEGHISVET
ncbi:hypothetical protein V8D89_000987 [Ganoderma adspersum]